MHRSDTGSKERRLDRNAWRDVLGRFLESLFIEDRKAGPKRIDLDRSTAVACQEYGIRIPVYDDEFPAVRYPPKDLTAFGLGHLLLQWADDHKRRRAAACIERAGLLLPAARLSPSFCKQGIKCVESCRICIERRAVRVQLTVPNIRLLLNGQGIQCHEQPEHKNETENEDDLLFHLRLLCLCESLLIKGRNVFPVLRGRFFRSVPMSFEFAGDAAHLLDDILAFSQIEQIIPIRLMLYEL